MRALILILLLTAFPALADDMVARNGHDTLRLTQEPCHEDILAAIRDPYKDRVHAAHAIVDGQSHRACWAVLHDNVILQYEDGDGGTVPLADFKREPGV